MMIGNMTPPSRGRRQSDGDTWAARMAGSLAAGATAAAGAVISCALCDAGFVPMAGHEYLLQASAEEREAAFMSESHFCFRCRRAACPECWDPIHRLCGQCVTEVGLAFHAEPSPLKGALLPPASLEQQVRNEAAPSLFVCVRPGRYRSGAAPETGHTQQPAAGLPQEMAAQIYPIAMNGSDRRISLPMPALVAPVTKEEPAEAMEQGAEERPRKSSGRVFKIIERVLTIILLIVLLVIAALIIVAEASWSANATIVHLLHVDIRAEVAYLVVLVKQIHW